MLNLVTAAALLLTLKSANALILPDDVVCLHSSRVTRPLLSAYKIRVILMLLECKGKITSFRLELMERLRL